MPALAEPIAQSSQRRISIKKESMYGAPAGASGATVIRRTTTGLNLEAPEVASNEKRSDFQEVDVGLGSRMVQGPIDGELICGAWEMFFAALVRRDFSSISAVAASTGDGFTVSSGVLTRAAGGSQSFLTDGFRVGMVIRPANMSTTTLNNRNLLITAMTATTLTLAALDNAAIADQGTPDEAASLTVVGQVSWVPSTGHTSDSFNIEDYSADIDSSDLYLGCRIVGCTLTMQPNNMVTVSWRIMGQDMETYETSSAPYFTSPTSLDDNDPLQAAKGFVRVYGETVGTISGLTIEFDLGGATIPVAGAEVSPDVFYGSKIRISGQITAMVKSAANRTRFKTQVEGELFFQFREPGGAPTDFISIFLPRVKLLSANKDDPETAIMQTLNFRALKKKTTAGYESTNILVQDSTLS